MWAGPNHHKLLMTEVQGSRLANMYQNMQMDTYRDGVKRNGDYIGMGL